MNRIGEALLPLLLVCGAACSPPSDVDALAAEIDSTFGVRVVHRVDDDFFPAAWLAQTEARATGLSPGQTTDLLEALPDWLEAYPRSVLDRFLDSIRLSQTLEMDGLPAAGTITARDIYIAVGSWRGESAVEAAKRTFHHEMSSVLAYGAGFALEEWYDARSPGLEYMSDPDEIRALIGSGDAGERSDRLHRLGAVEAYGLTGWENDLNTYAEEIFASPDSMRRFIDEYPAMRAKYLVLKRFYLDLSPEFTPVFERIEN